MLTRQGAVNNVLGDEVGRDNRVPLQSRLKVKDCLPWPGIRTSTKKMIRVYISVEVGACLVHIVDQL